jgi:hypothetical protein
MQVDDWFERWAIVISPLLLCLTVALVERDGLTRLIVGNPSALDTLSGVGLLVLLLTTLAAWSP